MTSNIGRFFGRNSEPQYQPAKQYRDDEESTEGLISEKASRSSSETVTGYAGKDSSSVRLRVSMILNVISLLAIAILLSINIPRWREQRLDTFNNTILKQFSMPSPILDQIHIPFTTIRRNGSLLPDHPVSVYRMDPSPEVDRAWNRLANINPIPISSKDVRNLGLDPANVAQWPAAYGLGDDAYVGRLDVFHEIHCLDMLRREIHYDYYYPKWAGGPSSAPLDHRVHISHCIYALLQSLQCTANTDAFVHYWVDIGDEPYPDFSIERKCKNFDTILAYQEENSIPMKNYRGVIEKPQGVIPQIMTEEYKYMVGLVEQRLHKGDTEDVGGDFFTDPLDPSSAAAIAALSGTLSA